MVVCPRSHKVPTLSTSANISFTASFLKLMLLLVVFLNDEFRHSTHISRKSAGRKFMRAKFYNKLPSEIPSTLKTYINVCGCMHAIQPAGLQTFWHSTLLTGEIDEPGQNQRQKLTYINNSRKLFHSELKYIY